MTVTYQDYVNTLKSGIYKVKCKIEWLRREDESVYSEFTAKVLSGNLTIGNGNGIRRSCNLVLDNRNKEFIPSEDTIWIQQKFKLSLGLEINGEDFLFPQGVFVLSNPQTASKFSNKIINITGSDKFSLLNGELGGELDGIYQIPVGSDINQYIKAMLNLVEDKKSPILQSTNELTPYTLRKETGNTYGDILLELAGMLSRNIYYDVNGHLVFEEDKPDNVKGSLWDFTTEEVLYQGATNNYKFNEVYSAVKVIGDNVEGDIATGYARNDNLQSPTRWQIVKRTKVINDDVIPNDTLAQARAEYELKRVIAVQSSVNLESISMYHLEENGAITITDDSLDFNRERHIIQSIDLPLDGKSQMTITAVKASEFN